MTDQFKRENAVADISALQQLSEHDLKGLRHDILSLMRDIQRILLFDDEVAEEVTSTQTLLNKWYGLVECALAVKQRSVTQDQLSNWDNEGGM